MQKNKNILEWYYKTSFQLAKKEKKIQNKRALLET